MPASTLHVLHSCPPLGRLLSAWNPRFLSSKASYDMANESNICQALYDGDSDNSDNDESDEESEEEEEGEGEEAGAYTRSR